MTSLERRQDVNFKQNTKHITVVLFLIQNVSCEILKSWLLLILKVFEKPPVDILKMSRKDFHRVTFLARPPNANFEPLIQMYFIRIIFNFVSTNVWSKSATAEAKEQPLDSYKTKLHFCKIVMHVLNQRRLGINVFRVTEIEKIYTEPLLEDSIGYTPYVTRFP